MAGPSEADEATDAGDETGTESEAAGCRRVVEAGAGADVPLDGGEHEAPEPDGATDTAAEGAEAPTERAAVASDGGGTDAADATDADDEAATFDDIADGDGGAGVDESPDAADEAPRDGDGAVNDPAGSDEPSTGDHAGSDGAAGAEDAADASADVPPELRALLSESDDADVRSLVDEVTGDSAATDDSAPSRGASTAESTGAADADVDDYGVADHHAEDPTDIATTDPGGEDLAPTEDAEEPAAETEPVSMRSEMSPALAERQAFLSLLIALGAGALFATLGNVLQLSRWQTFMLLVSAGIVVLLIATFVVFRAMLAAAERNDEPYRTAYTHPLFMLLFGVTTAVTALFVGYVSRLVT
jgi:hypothetical protein